MFPIKYESSMKPCILELETLYWMAEIMSVSTGRFSKVLVFCSQLTPSPTPITQWDQSLQLEHCAISHWSRNEFSKCLGANCHIFLPFIDLILSCPSRPTAACLLVNGLTVPHFSAILQKLCLLRIPLMLCFIPQNQTIDCVPHPESSIWCSFPSKNSHAIHMTATFLMITIGPGTTLEIPGVICICWIIVRCLLIF